MHFSTVLVAVTSLFLGADANPMRRDDPNRLNFRIWSVRDCGASGSNTGNLGVWTITQSQTGQCQKTFNAPAESPVKGIYINAIESGCQLLAFTNNNCEGTGQQVAVENCAEPPQGDASWSSFSVRCNAQ